MNHAGRFRLPLPPATAALFVANVAVFVLNMLLLGRLSDPAGGAWFAFSWPGLFDGYGLGFVRLLTYQFTHAFAEPMHVLMNMIALWLFGPMAEERLGRTGTVRLYVWAGLAGAIGHLLVATVQGATAVPLVGASGACYGLLVYAACVAPQQRIVFVIVMMPLWGLATLLCGLGAYSLFVELATGYPNGVSHSAHLGGAALGLAAFRAGWFRDWRDDARGGGWLHRLTGAWRRRGAERAARVAAAREHQLDTILAKVKAEGLGALRADERRFLERVSHDSHSRGS